MIKRNLWKRTKYFFIAVDVSEKYISFPRVRGFLKKSYILYNVIQCSVITEITKWIITKNKYVNLLRFGDLTDYMEMKAIAVNDSQKYNFDHPYKVACTRRHISTCRRRGSCFWRKFPTVVYEKSKLYSLNIGVGVFGPRFQFIKALNTEISFL